MQVRYQAALHAEETYYTEVQAIFEDQTPH